MLQMKWTVWMAALFGAALMLSGCSLIDDTPSYRYKLTVEVDTPQGPASGSSVIEVDTNFGVSTADPSSWIVMSKLKGEAVAIDLPDGRTLFALLRSESENEWAKGVFPANIPQVAGGGKESIKAQLQAIKATEHAIEIKRTYPAYAWIEERSGYPMLVTFGDSDDPTSVVEVDPDDLSSSFGEGYALKRITVQITDEPVTTGIEKRLGWLDAYRNIHLDGTSTVSEDLTTDDIRASLTAGSFSTEFAR